jgi:hypothetical protein
MEGELAFVQTDLRCIFGFFFVHLNNAELLLIMNSKGHEPDVLIQNIYMTYDAL